MHQFDDLLKMVIDSHIRKTSDMRDTVEKDLERLAPTRHIKNLQMLQLQNAIVAIGIFSLFESFMQGHFMVGHSISHIKEVLKRTQPELLKEFEMYRMAINVLKHGRGTSHDQLLQCRDRLPFQLREYHEEPFFEGDVSEIATLIQVDDMFLLDASRVISAVYRTLESES